MRWLWLLVFACPAGAVEITPQGLDDLPKADVYILGEVHDNAEHHRNQARAVAAIVPKGIVWEMLGQDQGPLVVTGAPLAELDEALGWAGKGWPELSLYYPIFASAGGARHYGAEVPRDDLRQAMQGAPPAIIGYGLDTALAPDIQEAAEAEQAAVHCDALPPEKLPGMVAAQRLRDAALAQAAVQAMADTGGPVVVITGTGHARRDRGVPAVLSQAAPDLRVVSVGQYEGDPGPDAPFDLWIVTPARTGSDPCDAFR